MLLAVSLTEQYQRWAVNLSDLDVVIIALGAALVLLHLYVLTVAIGVRRPATHARLLMLLRFGSFTTELLPLLGIIGTVLALLMTLSSLGSTGTFDIQQVTHDFAPALSTTVSGLTFAVINLIFNALGLIMLKENLASA